MSDRRLPGEWSAEVVRMVPGVPVEVEVFTCRARRTTLRPLLIALSRRRSRHPRSGLAKGSDGREDGFRVLVLSTGVNPLKVATAPRGSFT